MTPTVTGAWLLSIVLWLIPLVVLQVVRAHRYRPLWAVALDVPFAVALDLLSVMLLARFVRLEVAILISRPAWLVGGVAFLVRRWRRSRVRPEWPVVLRAKDLLAAVAAGALAVALCSGISFTYVVWDSGWHMPLVTTLVTEKIPFMNALSPREVLHYHFSGDVLAAEFRTFSFDIISAARALPTAHDAMFAALAFTLALLCISIGLSPPVAAAFSGAAVVLQGPMPLRGGLGHPFAGFSYHLFMNLSYRPHVPIAGLMFVGVLGTLAARAASPSLATSWTAPVLFAAITLLGVTDEASTALLGAALGIAWLVDCRLLARTRLAGLFVLIGLGLAIAGINVALAASFAPGSPVQAVNMVPVARIPPIWGGAALPLSTSDGKTALFYDFLPMLACAMALVLVAVRLRSRPHAAIAAFAWALIGLCAFFLTRVEINHDGPESARFVAGPLFACVALALMYLHRFPRGSFGSALVLLGVFVPACYGLYWTHEAAPVDMVLFKDNIPTDRLNDLDCRAVAGARFGEQAKPAYVETEQFFHVTACRPVLTFGELTPNWTVRVKPAYEPIPQLSGLDANLVGRRENLDAICFREASTKSDPVCTRALQTPSRCRPEGSRYLRCELTPADRDVLLGRAPAAAK